MYLKSDGILVKFPFFQGNVGKIFVSVAGNQVCNKVLEIVFPCNLLDQIFTLTGRGSLSRVMHWCSLKTLPQ